MVVLALKEIVLQISFKISSIVGVIKDDIRERHYISSIVGVIKDDIRERH